jgi:hypothetical protein
MKIMEKRGRCFGDFTLATRDSVSNSTIPSFELRHRIFGPFCSFYTFSDFSSDHGIAISVSSIVIHEEE